MTQTGIGVEGHPTLKYRAAIQFMNWNRILLMDSRDDPSFLWHHCGSLVFREGVGMDIFVCCDDRPGSSCEPDRFRPFSMNAHVDDKSVDLPVSVSRLKHL